MTAKLQHLKTQILSKLASPINPGVIRKSSSSPRLLDTANLSLRSLWLHGSSKPNASIPRGSPARTRPNPPSKPRLRFPIPAWTPLLPTLQGEGRGPIPMSPPISIFSSRPIAFRKARTFRIATTSSTTTSIGIRSALSSALAASTASAPGMPASNSSTTGPTSVWTSTSI